MKRKRLRMRRVGLVLVVMVWGLWLFWVLPEGVHVLGMVVFLGGCLWVGYRW